MSEHPLGSAILSLLVTADQRCPAIIGGAHLLYYARYGSPQQNAEMTIRQLRRDVDDLAAAVAAAEAAIRTPEAEPPVKRSLIELVPE